MCRLFVPTASWAIFFALASVRAATAQPDLVVQKTDVSVAKSMPGDLTYVTVAVHNTGSSDSGPFTLRVGATMGGASSTLDFSLSGLPVGQSIARTATFAGTGWKCGWGNADLHGGVAEQSETNNCANKNEYWIAMGPGSAHDETIGVVNPGLETEQVLLTLASPPGWIVTVDPTHMSLGPGEHRDAVVHFFAPQDFHDQVTVALYCVFFGGTPGFMDWEFRIETPVPVESTTWGAVKALFGH